MIARLVNHIVFSLLRFARNLPVSLSLGAGVFVSSWVVIVSLSLSETLQPLFVDTILGDLRFNEIVVRGETEAQQNPQERPYSLPEIVSYVPKVGMKRKSIGHDFVSGVKELEGLNRVIPITDVHVPIAVAFDVPGLENIFMGGSLSGLPSDVGAEYLDSCAFRPVYKECLSFGACAKDLCRDLHAGLGFEGFAPAELSSSGDVVLDSIPGSIGKKVRGRVPVIVNSLFMLLLDRLLVQNGLPSYAKEDLLGLDLRFILGKTSSPFASSAKRGMSSEERNRILEIPSVIAGFAPPSVVEAVAVPNSVVHAFRSFRYADEKPRYDRLIIRVEEGADVGLFSSQLSQKLEVLPSNRLKEYRLKCAEIYRHNKVIIDEEGSLSPRLLEEKWMASSGFAFDCKKLYHFYQDDMDSRITGSSVTGIGQMIQGVVLGIAAILFILSLIAVVYAFLYLVLRRIREIGLARFYGASRFGIIWGISLESAFIGLLTSFLGFVLASASLDFLADQLHDLIIFLSKQLGFGEGGGNILKSLDLDIAFSVSPPVAIYTIIACTLGSFISAFIPAAYQVSRGIDQATR